MEGFSNKLKGESSKLKEERQKRGAGRRIEYRRDVVVLKGKRVKSL